MFDNILNFSRYTIYALLLMVGLFLMQEWQREHTSATTPEKETQTITNTATATQVGNRYAPNVDLANPSAPVEKSAPASIANTGPLVKVQTDVLDITIDTRGGDIIESKLLKFPESLGSNQPFLLMNNDPKSQYIAESGLLSKVGPDTSEEQALYTAKQMQYSLQAGQKAVSVDMTWENRSGLTVIKTYTFTRGSYEVLVTYTIKNQTSEAWQGRLYTQLLRTDAPPVNGGGMVNLTTYFGAAISTPEKPFDKISFKDMTKQALDKTVANGWAAMIQHYFISAWVPPQNATSTYYTKVTPDGLYGVGMIGQPISVAPNATLQTTAKLYTGPATADQLEKTAPGLKLTIDYGWFWFISGIIFWMMQKIYDVVHNWGWSIVIVTIIIKLMFYHLSAKSYRSMSALKRLQPKIEMLKQRYGDDRQKLTKATMDLYKEEKVSPFGGCLPILVQIPVFIALYWVLVESVELRQAPFILWIKDLSVHDPYYILPIFMGISMFVQQKLNPPPPDPMQAKLMLMMPIVFTVLFASFPAGLMLYWFVNNSLSVLQQWHIMYSHEKASAK